MLGMLSLSGKVGVGGGGTDRSIHFGKCRKELCLPMLKVIGPTHSLLLYCCSGPPSWTS